MDWNNEPGFDGRTEKYLPLDLTAWLKKHGIENEGRKQGAGNQPPTDAEEFDATEASIWAWVHRRARVCRDNVGGHLSDLERELADVDNDEQLVTLGQRVDQMEHDARLALERNVDVGRNVLVTLEQAVREDNEDFRAFRQSNSLTRQADYSHRRGALPFILICFVVEVVLNAALLMEVNAFGLIGSTAQMGLISAVNVLICGLAMGGLLRQSKLRATPRKAAAWVGIVVLLAGVGAFNLAVGHFRDSMQAVVTNPGADISALGNDVLVRFAASPAGLESFQSYLLALLGFLFFCVASWKWLQRDDPYPDYGRRHRQLEKRKKDYVGRYNEMQEALRQTFAEHESDLEDVRERLEIKRSKWRDACVRGRNLVEQFPVQMGQYASDLDSLMSAYRTANRAARTEPPPRHFDAKPEFEPGILEPAPTFSPPPETNLTEVMQSVHDAIRNLQNVYRDAARRYPTLEHLMVDAAESSES